MKKNIALLLTLTLCSLAEAQNDTKNPQHTNTAIYTRVDTEPEFPGGMEKLYQFIAANITFPANNDSPCEGSVLVSFIIERDGSVSNASVTKNPCPDSGYAEEAIRVVKLMPKWKPGRQDGEKVRVLFTLPVKFSTK